MNEVLRCVIFFHKADVFIKKYGPLTAFFQPVIVFLIRRSIVSCCLD